MLYANITNICISLRQLVFPPVMLASNVCSGLPVLGPLNLDGRSFACSAGGLGEALTARAWSVHKVT